MRLLAAWFLLRRRASVVSYFLDEQVKYHNVFIAECSDIIYMLSMPTSGMCSNLKNTLQPVCS